MTSYNLEEPEEIDSRPGDVPEEPQYLTTEQLRALLAEYERDRLAPAVQEVATALGAQLQEHITVLKGEIEKQNRMIQRSHAAQQAPNGNGNGHLHDEELTADVLYEQANQGLEEAKKQMAGSSDIGVKAISLGQALLPLIQTAFAEWMNYKQFMFSMTNPFEVFKNWQKDQPELTQYLAMRAAPRDPLESQVPHLMARSMGNTWDTAFRAGVKAAQTGGVTAQNPLEGYPNSYDEQRNSNTGQNSAGPLIYKNRPGLRSSGNSYEKYGGEAQLSLVSFRDLRK